MVKQSNPVLYFLTGEATRYARILEETLRKYIDGFAVVSAPLGFDGEQFISSVNDARQKFYRHRFASPGVIRVGHILTADGSALSLPALLSLCKKYIEPLYPSGVFTDVYCLFDDVNFSSAASERGSVQKMSDRMMSDKNLNINFYLFSNVGSSQTLISEQGLFNTVALLALFKDAEPSVAADMADSFRYNEFNFTDSCYARSRLGRYLTAGYASLSYPRDAVRNLLAACFLTLDKNQMFFSDTSFEALNDYTSLCVDVPFAKSGLDYTLGLAVNSPPGRELASMTNGAVVKRLFGSRLDKIIDEEDFEYEPPSVPRTEGSIYALMRISGENGRWRTGILNALDRNSEELRAIEAMLNDWLNSKPHNKEKRSRSLSFIVRQNLIPYRIAGKYMRLSYDVKRLRKREALLRETLALVENFHRNILLCLPLVESTISELSRSEAEVNERFSLFSNGAADFFKKKFAAFAEHEKLKLTRLTNDMTEALIKNKFPSFMERLKDYIEHEVLTSEEFAKPIIKIAEEMSGGAPQSRLAEWIAKNKGFNIQLKTGYAGLYSEVNVFMRPEKAAELKRDYERGRERVNLFTSENADSLEVLYHGGAFGSDDLYFKGLYEHE